jgi:hypothetical protein
VTRAAALILLLALPAIAGAQERRALPDYDGRVEPGDDAIDVALWIPRVLTSPLYFVSEFVLRRPLGWLLTEIERGQVIQLLAGVLTFGPEHNIGVFPTAFFEFGLLPSVGLYGFWSDFLFEGNRLSVHAATWGEDWLSLSSADRIRVEDGLDVHVTNRLIQRPDALFAGVGSAADTEARARFGISAVESRIGLALDRGGPFTFAAYLQHRSIAFAESNALGGLTISEWATQQGRELPMGYPTGYQSLSLRLDAALDTRERGGPPQGGARLGVHVGEAGTIDGPVRGNWLLVGGELFGGVDLGRNRVLSLRGDLSMITAPSDVEVPFYELLDPGGTGPMRGFLPGLLRGESIAVVTLEYAWPIWALINGRLHLAAGNAFARHFEDFDAERLRLSFGLGIEPRIGGEHPFELTVAFGTDTFEHGATVDSVRFVFGARNAL